MVIIVLCNYSTIALYYRMDKFLSRRVILLKGCFLKNSCVLGLTNCDLIFIINIYQLNNFYQD